MQDFQVIDPRTQPASEYRVAARLALIARADTIFGTFRAGRLLERLTRSPHAHIYEDAVISVYHASNWTVVGHAFYECPNCGSVHYGEDNAWGCCNG